MLYEKQCHKLNPFQKTIVQANQDLTKEREDQDLTKEQEEIHRFGLYGQGIGL